MLLLLLLLLLLFAWPVGLLSRLFTCTVAVESVIVGLIISTDTDLTMTAADRAGLRCSIGE